MADMSGAPDPKPEPIEPTLVEQTGDVPETVTPENATDPVEPAAEEVPAVETKPEATAPPVKKPWFQTRIDELTKARREAERLAAERDAELKLLKAKPADDGTAPPPQMTQAEWDRQVEQAADRKVQQQAINSKSQAWLSAGVKEFGQAKFDEDCSTLAALGGADKPEFIAMLVDPDLIPEGHKVVARLADDPEEAQRIVNLPPVQMAAALTRFAMTAPPEKKSTSAAPKPITPIAGSVKASAPSDGDDMKTWLAKRNATARTTAGGKPAH